MFGYVAVQKTERLETDHRNEHGLGKFCGRAEQQAEYI